MSFLSRPWMALLEKLQGNSIFLYIGRPPDLILSGSQFIDPSFRVVIDLFLANRLVRGFLGCVTLGVGQIILQSVVWDKDFASYRCESAEDIPTTKLNANNLRLDVYKFPIELIPFGFGVVL